MRVMDSFEDLLHSHARALAKECMDPMVIYSGVLGLFVLGVLLFRNTSIHEFVGGREYESKRRRRFAGVTLMALAVICGEWRCFPNRTRRRMVCRRCS